MSPVDAEIAVLAGRQHGNVTRRQLLAVGLDSNAIAYRLKTGRLFRVHAGVYSVGHRPVTPLEHATAAVLAGGPDAAPSHRSAALLWGFLKGQLTAPFDVTVPATADPRESASTARPS
jgi:Transcriptional regulator, AbiEi antitoxin